MVFDTSLATRGTNYKSYFPALKQSLGNPITIDRIDGETPWSKFILHGTLIDTSMEAVTTSLHSNYPKLTLAQTRRWLIADKERYATKKDGTPKTGSAVVIALIENHSL